MWLWIGVALAGGYADEVASDRPLSHWETPGKTETQPLFGGDQLTVEFWVGKSRKTSVSYGDELKVSQKSGSLEVLWQNARLDLSLNATPDFDDGWHHVELALSDGALRATVDGMLAEDVPVSTALSAGQTWSFASVRHVVLHDRALPAGRALSRTRVARGEIGPTPTGPVGLVAQTGHGDDIVAIAQGPTRRLMLTGGMDGVVKLWDLDKGVVVRNIALPGRQVSAVAVAPDGRTGAASFHGDAFVFDLGTGELLQTIPSVRTTGVAFSDDGRRLAVSSRETAIQIWDTATGERLATRGRFSGELEWIGDALLVSRDFGSVGLLFPDAAWWDTAGEGTAAEYAYALRGISAEGRTARLSPDGRYVGMASRFYASVQLYSVESGETVSLGSGDGVAGGISFSADSTRMASAGESGVIRIWDVESREEVMTLDMGQALYQTAFFDNGRQLYAGDTLNRTRIWDLETGSFRVPLPVNQQVVGMALAPDGRHLHSCDASGAVSVWDLHDVRQVLGYRNPEGGCNGLAVSQETIAITHPSKLTLLNAATRAVIGTADTRSDGAPMVIGFTPEGGAVHAGRERFDVQTLENTSGIVSSTTKVPDRAGVPQKAKRMVSIGPRRGPQGQLAVGSVWLQLSVTRTQDEGYALWDVKSHKEVRPLQIEDGVPADIHSVMSTFSPDGRFVAARSGFGDVAVFDLESGYQVQTQEGKLLDLAYTPDSTELVTVERGGEVIWRDADSGQVNKTMAHGSAANVVVFFEDGRVATAGEDGAIRIHSRDGTQVTLLGADDGWLVYDDKGHFDASTNGAVLAAAAAGTEVYDLESLAVLLNQPHELLTTLRVDAPQLAADFRAAHDRRVQGLSASDSLLPPNVTITSVSAPADGAVEMDLSIHSRTGLRSYQIWANGVPLFAEPPAIEGGRVKTTVTVPLVAGANHIEASAADWAGVESPRARVRVVQPGEARGDLYFIGLGVSDYRYSDKRLPDLAYAHQDAIDLEQAFAAAGTGFGAVHTKVFSDDEVTAAALDTAAELLAKATPQDTVVLFVAGHGLREPGANGRYYYLVHDTKLDDLPGTAVGFDRIETLLYDTKARQKLFLMDTCQSGANDDAVALAEVSAAFGARAVRGLEVVAKEKAKSKGKGPAEASTAPTVAPAQDRLIFLDLVRRSGAIVLASSRGWEASLESKDWKNGAFTEAILQGLRDGDADGSGAVSTDELRNFVQEQVPKLTEDLQHPRVDRDNVHAHFSFPLPQ